MCEGNHCCVVVFFVQAEDGIRDLVRSRGLGDVYKRQTLCGSASQRDPSADPARPAAGRVHHLSGDDGL